MYIEILDKIKSEISGQMALRNVTNISQFHRIPGYKGQCDAAKSCEEILRKNNVDAKAAEYPADGKTMFWSFQTPEGWECSKGELWITYPESEKGCIANFKEMEMSLLQRSGCTPEGGVEAELVVVNNPEEETLYQNLEVKGKFILVGNCDLRKVYDLAVEDYGALGIVTDNMPEFPPIRERIDLPDAINWSGFNWTKEDKRCFGFAVSPRIGDKLRKIQNVRLNANVESTFTNSKFMNVEALIQGDTNKEIVVIAHLCHPRPSANDNASGAGTAMEVARVLNELISNGKLPKPKRSIRFLLVPEFLGTYAFLSNNEDKVNSMLAGINLDMVGQNQELCKSALQLEKPPLAAPGYVGDLLEEIFKTINVGTPNFLGTGKSPLFRYTVNQFSGGSDHYILSDPTINIPCPMIGQWPDRYYHTSMDTIDKVDPDMLKRVGTATAVYAYFLANAGFEEISWLAGQIALKFGEEVRDVINNFNTSKKSRTSSSKVKDIVKFRLSLRIRDLKELEKYVPQENIDAYKKLSDKLSEQMKDISKSQMKINNLSSDIYLIDNSIEEDQSLIEWEEKAKGITPIRKYPAPIPHGLRGYLHLLSLEEREEWRMFLKNNKNREKIDSLLIYWADGSRNLSEIMNVVEIETGCYDPEFAVKYFSILEKVGLIELVVS
jgi:aminopeptidase YwaD